MKYLLLYFILGTLILGTSIINGDDAEKEKAMLMLKEKPILWVRVVFSYILFSFFALPISIILLLSTHRRK